MPEERIEAVGEIVEILDRQAYRVRLSNGHICIARASRAQAAASAMLAVGDCVMLSFSPAELSRARLTGRAG